MSKKILFIFSLFALSNLAPLPVQAAKPDCKGEACYCERGVQAKNILGKIKAEDYISVCKVLKDDKEVKKYEKAGHSADAAERACLDACGEGLTKEAVEDARKKAAAKAAMPPPRELPLRTSGSYPCKGDRICVCTDAVMNKTVWESTCKHFNGGEVVQTFKGETNTKKSAIETCSRLCFGAQSSMIVQRADGVWQAK